MKMPGNVKSLRQSLRNLGRKLRAIIRLKRGWDSKLGDNFTDKNIRNYLGTLVSDGKCFNPPRHGVHQNQEIFNSSDYEHMNKIKLLVSSWQGAPALVR